MFSSSNALPCSIFDNIADAKLIFNSEKWQVSLLLANYTKFSQLSTDSVYL